jgi:YrbI family 3-deoxy-D-manno-octulosonate 8-phosphate phosphatase
VRRTQRGLGGLTLEQILREIRLIVFDFDGVFTDNRVLVGEDGSEYVFCNRADGLGLANLRRQGIECIVLSTEKNPVVARRCEKLKLECFQGCADKWATLKGILQKKKIDSSYVGYVGNDINDLACMENVGVAICVADACPEIKAISRLVTSRRGGEGAVRELCDLVIRAKNAKN